MEIRYYVSASGVDVFADWMRDRRDLAAKIAIDRRLARLELGNPGDAKSVGGGVFEMRIDVGPGYRVYFAKTGLTIILIMGGGDKKTQQADIAAAIEALGGLEKEITMRDRSRDDAMAEAFREDPSYAIALLNDILSDGPDARGEALIVLRQLAKAFGGLPALASAADLNQTQLYRMLSEEGNPTLESLSAILNAMGLRLAVQAAPKQSAA